MITVVCGTNRKESLSKKLAEFYTREIEKKTNATVHLIDLLELPPRFIVEEMYGMRSEGFRPVEAQMAQSDKFLFILPEYNGSFPGIVKLFVDAFDPASVFHHKKAALAGLAAGKFGNVRGIDHFTGVLNYLQVDVLPFKVHIPRAGQQLENFSTFRNSRDGREIQNQIDQFIQF